MEYRIIKKQNRSFGITLLLGLVSAIFFTSTLAKAGRVPAPIKVPAGASTTEWLDINLDLFVSFYGYVLPDNPNLCKDVRVTGFDAQNPAGDSVSLVPTPARIPATTLWKVDYDTYVRGVHPGARDVDFNFASKVRLHLVNSGPDQMCQFYFDICSTNGSGPESCQF